MTTYTSPDSVPALLEHMRSALEEAEAEFHDGPPFMWRTVSAHRDIFERHTRTWHFDQIWMCRHCGNNGAPCADVVSLVYIYRPFADERPAGATPGPEAEGQPAMPVRAKTPIGDAMVRLGDLALQFGRVDRVTFHNDVDRPGGPMAESDTDHTVMLTMAACSLAQIVNESRRGPALNVGLVAQLATVHDLPEADPLVGDTSTLHILTAEQQAAKKAREAAAADRIIDEFAWSMPWVGQTLVTYEAQQIPEARFVRAVDKLLPKVTHLLNGCRTLIAEGVSEEAVRERYRIQVDELRAYSAEWPIIAELHTELVGRVLAMYAAMPDTVRCEGCRNTIGPHDRRYESPVDPGVFVCPTCFVAGGGADTLAAGTHPMLSS